MCAGNRPGRPSKLTPEAADLLVAVLRAGGDVTAAARAAGVGRRTVYDWLAPGASERYGVLRGRVEEALAAGRAPRRATRPERTWEEVAAQLQGEWQDWRLPEPPPLDELLRATD